MEPMGTDARTRCSVEARSITDRGRLAEKTTTNERREKTTPRENNDIDERRTMEHANTAVREELRRYHRHGRPIVRVARSPLCDDRTGAAAKHKRARAGERSAPICPSYPASSRRTGCGTARTYRWGSISKLNGVL